MHLSTGVCITLILRWHVRYGIVAEYSSKVVSFDDGGEEFGEICITGSSTTEGVQVDVKASFDLINSSVKGLGSTDTVSSYNDFRIGIFLVESSDIFVNFSLVGCVAEVESLSNIAIIAAFNFISS